MSVKGKNFKIKNTQINPNLTTDGLIFYIDPVFSKKENTSYLYNNFWSFSNLISDGSSPYVISGTYTQTNNTLTSYSSSVTYSFGVDSFNSAYSFLSSGYINGILYDYFDNNNYNMYNFQDKAVFPIVNKSDRLSARWDPITAIGSNVEVSDEPLYHDDDLNLLFISGSTRTLSTTYSYVDSVNDSPILLVYDTNLNRLSGTISFGLTGSYSMELISIDDDLYCYVTNYLYYINKTNLTANLILNINDSGIGTNHILDYRNLKSFKFNNKKYILASQGGSNFYKNGNVHIYTVSPITASVYTFSVPQSYNSWSLTYSIFDRTPTLLDPSTTFGYDSISDVDIWGSTWSRLYIPTLGYSASNSYPNNQRSFVFIYGLTESGGNISINSTPIDVLDFPNTVINRIYKIPDLQEKFWSVQLPVANRDRLYLFGSIIESGIWSIATYSSATQDIQFGVNQLQVPSSFFKTGLLYSVSFYSGTQGSADRATYSSFWTWGSGSPSGGVPSFPGVGQFTSMASTFDGNGYFRLNRRSIMDYSEDGSTTATFSSFSQLVTDFNSGKQISMNISSYPNNYWVIRKNTPQNDIGSTFSSPYTDYILNTSPKTGYDSIGWRCFGRLNNFFYKNWNNYIRNISTSANIDRFLKYDEFSDRTYFGKGTAIVGTSSTINTYLQNRVCYNSTKNCYYTVRGSGDLFQYSPGLFNDSDYYYVVEINGDLNTSQSSGGLVNLGITTGYISLPNFGWQGFSNTGLRNKKVIDRITPVWDEGTISIWFSPRLDIGTSSTFQSLFSCWNPIKKNQGTTSATGRTFTQLSDNIEFFFGLGSFNANGSTITVKTRTKITYYRPLIDGSFNFTKKWYNITVSRSSAGLNVYLNGERLSRFSGDLESDHSTSTFINISGVNEKNSFFLNRRDSRVVVGGYRQLASSTGTGTTTPRYYHSSPIGLFNGFFSSVLVWRKELTDIEVKQNFNSLKSRFGL